MVKKKSIPQHKSKHIYTEEQLQMLSEREYFSFYISYFEMIDQLDDDMQLPLYQGIASYSFRGEQPDFSSHPKGKILQALWTGIEPNIRSNIAHFLNAKSRKDKSAKSETKANDERNGSECGAIIKNEEKNIKKEERSKEEILPPTQQEVSSYISSIGSSVNPNRFYDYHSATGWVDKNGNPIKDWKAVVRLWQDRDNPKPQVKERPKGKTLKDFGWL